MAGLARKPVTQDRPWIILLGLLLWAASLHAEEAPPPDAIRAGERLSDWLLRQPARPDHYATGLHWQVPGEHAGQSRLKYHLLAQLGTVEAASPAARQRLTALLEAAPITGRMPIARADARWLQAHPKEDPLLESGHAVLLSRRPNTVTVIRDDGYRCSLPHRSGGEARAYLAACQASHADQIDRAWVAQPDGSVRHFGIAPWNAQAQDEPAPGAVIWAPSRNSGWSPYFSTLLAKFLATQTVDTPALAVLPEASPTTAVLPTPRARDTMPTSNDWGLIGLLQTPTARMEKTGEARFNYSRVYPYGRSNIILQPLDWLETGFRYTNVSNRLYGTTALSGDQAYKDKSFDFKIRLAKESDRMPELALGMIDIGGTGMFSSEYLVASKRSGNFDWSLGMAWGYLGGSGNIRNPLSIFDKSFDLRQGMQSPSGGTVNTGSFFHGTTALFGGVQYHTPSDKWLIKVEYDGNNYQNEPQANNRPHSSPVNVGVVYRHNPAIDLSFGFERGNTFMVGLTFHGRLDKLTTPKLSDAAMPPVIAARPTEENPLWARSIGDIVALTRWSVRNIGRAGGDLIVTIEDSHGAYWTERIDRIAAVLHRDAPADIERFVLVFAEQGIPLTHRVILREPWVTKQIRLRAMSERFETVAAAEPRNSARGETLWSPVQSPFGTGIVPTFQQNLGGPDGFLLFRLGLAAPMKWRLSENTAITGAASLGLIDNFEKFKYDAPSNLPRVRTSVREYMTTTSITIPYLQATRIGQLGKDHYLSFYGGLLETMYAGIGAEWLYRPWHGNFAFGIDINRVQQRDFKQNFNLRDYRVNTGHATLYWDTGWHDTHVKLMAGQYLAGDKGVTVELGRTFANGIALGAWATKTNVSAAEFGEGSFDKGIYLNIPFDAMMTSLSPAIANLNWSFLTRDGGARLNRNASLFNLTRSRNKRLTAYAPADPDGNDDFPAWDGERSLVSEFGKSTLELGRQLTWKQTSSALMLGGGMVLASALLDHPVDQWASRNQTSRWNSAGKAASNIPYLLAAGTGMLWWGLGGEAASETAWSGIKAAALTLGAATATKLAVGRARPDSELGSKHFSPLGSGNANSSFPSIHTGVAFALVTPFAERYDAPWLYALAGATALGRIQERQHFVSDTVAGALIGYGIGNLLLEQQRVSQRGPRFGIGPDRSIRAAWDF